MENYLVRIEDVIWRRIGDEVVVIAEDGLSFHKLNQTAADIWELCDGSYKPEQIAEILCEKYDIALEEASADVHETIGKMVGLGIMKERERINQ